MLFNDNILQVLLDTDAMLKNELDDDNFQSLFWSPEPFLNSILAVLLISFLGSSNVIVTLDWTIWMIVCGFVVPYPT